MKPKITKDFLSLAKEAEKSDPKNQKDIFFRAFILVKASTRRKVDKAERQPEWAPLEKLIAENRLEDASTLLQRKTADGLKWHKDWHAFKKMIDADAFESAAKFLVPDGWDVSLYWGVPGFKPCAQIETEDMRENWNLEPISSEAQTIGLALTASCLKAHAQNAHAQNA